eukprot:CAMPEP_0206147638 /NCGR_PEP_ID=MMETSP1473-20131121/34031_1 /ASSEMBLY_ACC=CAM_ASM_001109 /TAXON_ID=1461547 /ORGANISM="Stichococcus sp, Strain RCC1054" /LENGTH=946 /DNA_ID=CAMNT_0053544649 /DNA_START=259 /DNA_END=3099 /DNA_ORIENTATION=+
MADHPAPQMDENLPQKPPEGCERPLLQHAQQGRPPLQGSQGQGAWRRHHTVFTNAKAGMDGVDRDHVQRVVYEMSKDSAHFRNEQRKQAQTDGKIARLRERAARLSPAELASHLRAADAAVAQAAATRDLTATWLVVDMDAFFASVEELHQPALKDKPMAVGGIGMISTANYVARKFGVRSAMPGFIARKLCPQLIFQRPDFSRYKEVSEQAQAVFATYDEDLEAASLDEAFLDITAYCAQHGCTGAEVAEELRRRVREETGVTCSCGVAPNRMLAKVCADRNKPDGHYVLPGQLEAVTRFMQGLPIRKVPGIGKVMEQTLKAFGVEYCSQLIEQRALLSALFSKVSMEYFMTVGLGLGATRHGERPAEGEVGRKGISCERTFAALSAPADLEEKLREISEKLAEHMAREGLQGRTLTLKLKSALTFELHTRAATLPGYISSAEQLLEVALQLLRPELPITVRLMGIRVSAFKEQPAPEPGQRTLAGFVRNHVHQGWQGSPADVAKQDVLRGSHPGSSAEAVEREFGSGLASPEHMRHIDRLPSLQSQQLLRQIGPSEESSDNGHPGGEEGPSAQCAAPATPLELSLHGWASEVDDTDVDGEEGGEEDAEGLVAASELNHSHVSSQPISQPSPRDDSSQPIELSLRDWQGAPGQAAPSTQRGSSGVVGRRGRWECRVCTYLNPRHLLRCELCDVPRSGPLLGRIAGSAAGSRTLSQDQQRARIASLFGEIPPSSAAPPAESLLPQQPVVEGNSAHDSPEAPDTRGLPGSNGAAGSDAAAAAADIIDRGVDDPTVNGAFPGNLEEPGYYCWRCRDCGTQMPAEQQQQHKDWHFAERLQRQSEPGRPHQASPSPAGSLVSFRDSSGHAMVRPPGTGSTEISSEPSRQAARGPQGGRKGHVGGPRMTGRGGRAVKRKGSPAAGGTIDVLLSRQRQAIKQKELPPDEPQD